MKKALIGTFALILSVPAVWAADYGWPDGLANVRRMVSSRFGDIPYHRVKVRRDGNATEVSIKLKNIPRQFRGVAREKAGDDDLFLATTFVDFIDPDFDVFSFDVFPSADFLAHNYGFVVLNFGKKIKRRTEIIVVGDGPEFSSVQRKTKMAKNSAFLRWIEDTVSEPGLYALHTTVGPYSQTNFFCASCD